VNLKQRRWAAALAVVAASVVAAGCSSSSSNSSGGGSSNNLTSNHAPGLPSLAEQFRGTKGTPPTTPAPAPKNKTVYILNCGAQVQSCNDYATAAVSAVKALGWHYNVVNANLNAASGDEKAIETAVAAHPDAIIQEAFSCSTDEPGLEQAKAAHIPVIGVETLDCSDVGGPQLFTVPLIYSDTASTGTQWWTNFGKYAADYIIAASGGQAKLIATFGQGDPQFTAMNKGFMSQFTKCQGCQMLEQVPFTPASQSLWLPTFKSALVKHPNANYVWVPFDSLAVESGGALALKASGVHAQLVSDIGESSALGMIRSGLISAEGYARDSRWMVWGAVDELVRYFDAQKPVPEGLGLVSVDINHNMPASPSSDYQSKVDYQAVYEKDWGVSGS
jgi:ribose transport system substrate-binding protein